MLKPTGYLVGYDISYGTSTGRKILTKKTNDFVKDYWPNETSVGQPKYYADEDDTRIRIAPAAVSSYQYRFSIEKQPTHLGVSTSSNYFSEKLPDALLYATMGYMSDYMKDFAANKEWESKYQNAISTISNQARRERRDNGSEPRNPTTNMNTLTGKN